MNCDVCGKELSNKNICLVCSNWFITILLALGDHSQKPWCSHFIKG